MAIRFSKVSPSSSSDIIGLESSDESITEPFMLLKSNLWFSSIVFSSADKGEEFCLKKDVFLDVGLLLLLSSK